MVRAQSDSELHAPLRRKLDVVTFEHLLHLDRSLNGLDRTWELGQQRVARRVDHATAAARDQARDDVAARLEGLDGRGLIGRHQAGIADHVRAQDRGELASAAWVSHRPLHGQAVANLRRRTTANNRTDGAHLAKASSVRPQPTNDLPVRATSSHGLDLTFSTGALTAYS